MPTRTIASIGERALIQRVTGRLATAPWVVIGPGDDAAVVEPERGALDVLTTDVQVEGVHFDRRFMEPDDIGYRALAVNLSDLAAMGARPRTALLSLVLPDSLDVAVVDGLLDGMLALANAHHMPIVGGNIARSPGPMIIDVTAIGSIRRRHILTRGGARPGDAVYVTGSIGDAMVGLESLQQKADLKVRLYEEDGGADTVHVGADLQVGPCEERYRRPEPRVRAGMLLARNRAASACMDLSDGLADAVRQVAEASQVGITLDADALPIAAAVRSWHEGRTRNPVDAALQGGDDYELLFTVRRTQQGRLRGVKRLLGTVPITRIGVVTKERPLLVRTTAGNRELPAGFQHFT